MTTETLEFAITVRQPWAWALAAGHKPVENRTWRPGLEHVGRLIGIHAGQHAPDNHEAADVWRALPPGAVRGDAPELVRGALIGVARLVGVVRQTPWVHGEPDGCPTRAHVYTLMQGQSVGTELPKAAALRIEPWWRGPWGWLFGEVMLLPEPIPMRGQQGLWRIPTVAAWVTNYDEDGRFQIDERKLTASDLALEQWRKARDAQSWVRMDDRFPSSDGWYDLRWPDGKERRAFLRTDGVNVPSGGASESDDPESLGLEPGWGFMLWRKAREEK